jgi:hypothetical protein
MRIQNEHRRVVDTRCTGGSDIRQVRRRVPLGFFLFLLPWSRAAAQPKLGDDEWFRQFRAFVKLFNAFVESLNDGRLDLSTWRQMRDAWKAMDRE